MRTSGIQQSLIDYEIKRNLMSYKCKFKVSVNRIRVSKNWVVADVEYFGKLGVILDNFFDVRYPAGLVKKIMGEDNFDRQCR